MQFAAMTDLGWGWLVLGVVLAFLWGYFRRKHLLSRFVSPGLWSVVLIGEPFKRRFVTGLLFSLGVGCLFLAVLRPQFGVEAETVQRKGRNVVMLVDVSASMLAADVGESRLTYAKREIVNMLPLLKEDRVGLVVFSGTAVVLCPLTMDMAALRLFLDDMRPGMISRPGSNLATAIRTGREMLASFRGSESVMIVFSDGESFEGNALGSAEVAAKRGLKIYTVGMGSNEGSPILLADDSGLVLGYKTDRAGSVVVSRLNSTQLKAVAEETGGAYFQGDSNRFVSEDIYRELDRLDRDIFEQRLAQRYIERYQWVAVPGFFLILLAFAWPLSFLKRFRTGVFMAVFFWFFSLTNVIDALGVVDYKSYRLGKAAMAREDYSAALAYFSSLLRSDVRDSRVYYNLGNVYYRLGDFEQAQAFYEKAAMFREDVTDASAFSMQYNLGNAYVNTGAYAQAKESYEAALKLDPDDPDAQHNLALVERLLSEEAAAESELAPSSNRQDTEPASSEGKASSEENEQGVSSNVDATEASSEEDASTDGSGQDALDDEGPEQGAADGTFLLGGMDDIEAASRQKYLQRPVAESRWGVKEDW